MSPCGAIGSSDSDWIYLVGIRQWVKQLHQVVPSISWYKLVSSISQSVNHYISSVWLSSLSVSPSFLPYLSQLDIFIHWGR